jgi:DNA polymerase elongation subunit (family B)
MGESTTGTGRMILRHQCSKTNEVLTGEYDPTGEAIIYGDTDSTYFKTYATTAEQAIKIADAVAAKVNDSYPEFMRTSFLCTPGYDNIIKAGREIVSDRGIFVEKKRYILHVADKEGKRTDELKVMGLDTKKTSLPKVVGEKLNGFIEAYLKGEDWDTIALQIIQYKDDLRNSENILDIGLPRGIKNVDKYTTEYEVNGDNARLPGHVAAAIHYNLTVKKYNDKDSVPITSGMKIKVFYLKGNHGKFKSIAIPTDTTVAPPWFLKDFTVDYDAHIERLVDNPLANIIKAIGKEVPTPHLMRLHTAWEF